MIDNIKISTKAFDHKRLLKDPTFNFTSRINMETGEIVKNAHGNCKKEAFLHGLKIIIYHNHDNTMRLFIVGSIHKFFNNGAHNYNDFVHSDIITTIDRLSRLFYFDANTCKLDNVEIGVNIYIPVKASKILIGLLCHRNKGFKSISMDDAEYYQVMHTNYFIKIYNKAKQYKAKGFHIEGELLRYELKYIKMFDLVKLLNSKLIIDRDYLVLADLKNIALLNAFSELLITKWQELLFYDHSIIKKRLSNNLKKKLFAWSNKDYWLELEKQSRSKQKKRLYHVISNHSQNLQKVVGGLISNKIEILIQKGLPFNQTNKIIKDDLLTNTINDSLINERLPFNTIYKGLKSKPFEMNVPYVKECNSEEEINVFESQEKKTDFIIPDYNEFHSDPREIPF